MFGLNADVDENIVSLIDMNEVDLTKAGRKRHRFVLLFYRKIRVVASPGQPEHVCPM